MRSRALVAIGLCTVCLAACGPSSGTGVLYETVADRQHRERDVANHQKMQDADQALAHGDEAGAQKLYREVAQSDAEAIAPRQRLATLALRQHRYGEAEHWLREVIAIDPETAAPRYQLVSVLLRQRRVEEARKEFQAAQETPDSDARTELRLKGVLALKSGQTTQAGRLFDDFIAEYPDDADGYVGLAIVLASAGAYDDALAKLDKAAALAPRSAVVEYDLALVYYKKGDLDAAIDHGQKAVALDPAFLPARNNLASALLQQGRFDEARAQLEAALASRPTYAPAYNNLGVILFAQGKLDEAAEAFAQAIHHAPRVPAFHFNLGLVRFRQGRLDDARSEFEAVVQLLPNDAGARANLTWLDGVKKGTLKGTDLPSGASQYAVDEFDE